MTAGAFALLVPAILLAGVSLAGAQQLPAVPNVPLPPVPNVPLPPAPAALSVPNPFAGLHPAPVDLYRSPDGSDRFQHNSQYPAPPPPIFVVPGVYFPGPYYYPGPYHYPGSYYYDASMVQTTYPKRRREAVARGGLVLMTVPDIAQVYVDGYYVGLAEEFGLHGRAMEITAGTHRIELRAAGYEALAFSVMIAPNDILRYRGDMQPVSTKPAVVVIQSPPPAPRSFYVIPNCYAGDKPPTGTLPKGCDRKNLQTRK
jgi:hypothetical protein